MPTLKRMSSGALTGCSVQEVEGGSLDKEAMGIAVPIRCFTHDPSIKSSLKFLRRTPWAREKVEQLYLHRLKAKRVI